MITTAENSQREDVVKTKRTQLDAFIPLMKDKFKFKNGEEVINTLETLFWKKFFSYNSGDAHITVTDNNSNYYLSTDEINFILKLGWKISSSRDRYYLNDIKSLWSLVKVYSQDEFYILETKEWETFHVNIQDFNTHGISSKSLKFWKPPLKTKSNLVKKFTIDAQWHSLNLLQWEKIVSTIVWDLITVVDKDDWDVIVVHENLLEYIHIEDDGKQIPQRDPIAHPYGKIKKIKVDKNSNFLLLISEYEGGISKLHIVNRKNLEEVENHEGIVDIIQVDNKNDLTCLDSDGKFVSIDTNFDQFERGYVDNKKIGRKKVTEIKNVALSQLEALLWNGGIQIDGSSLWWKNTAPTSLNHQKKALVQKIWEIPVGSVTLKELFENADSVEAIDIVYQAFLLIQQTPEIEAIVGITTDIERAIIQKKESLLLSEIQKEFESLKTEFEEILHDSSSSAFFSRVLSLQKKIERIEAKRAQNVMENTSFDNDIVTLKDQIQAQIISYKLKNRVKLIQEIDENIEKLADVLKHIIYPLQITQIYNNVFYISIGEMIELLEDSEKENYKKQISELIQTRMEDIRKSEEQKKSVEEQKMKDIIEWVEKDIENLWNIISSIEEESTLESFKKSDILVQKIQSEIEKIPKSEAEKLSLALEGIFAERKQYIRLKKLEAKGVVRSLDEYGIDTSLYFSDRVKKQVWFKLLWQRTSQNTIKLEILFDNGTTLNIDSYLQNPQKYASWMVFSDIRHELSPSEFVKLQKDIAEYSWKWEKEITEIREKLLKKDYQNDEEKEWLQEKLKRFRKKYRDAIIYTNFVTHLANTLNLNPRSRLELPNPKFIVLDEEKELLQSMSIGFIIQKNEQKGIDILEWPPGLGKTEICRFFAANTNREIVRIQCSKMDPSDLFFSPQLKAGETSRQPAEWIQLMQKPGTIILFDEIDKLNPQSFERLHSLFDSARAIYDPQLWWIKAHKDCLFIGTRNSYEKMSNPIVSRSTITQIKAPSEENEAYKIAKYTGLSYFENMSFVDFQKIMHEWSKQQNIMQIRWYIMNLVNIFSDLRDLQKWDGSDDTFLYEISYRDAEQIFRRFSQSTGKSFKEIATEILVPKARAVVLDSDDKDSQEKIVLDIIKRHL